MNQKEAKQYVLKRVQAQQNSRSRVSKMLLTAALQLAKGKSEDNVTKDLSSQIVDVTNGYARTCLSFRKYDDGEKDLKKYMEDVHYGKTFEQRTDTYTKRYVSDIVELILACYALDYPKDKTLYTIQNSYKDPFNSPVIGLAIKSGEYTRKEHNYGVGRTNVASTAIYNNVENTIALAYSEIDHNYASFNGANGFYVYRGSSYPCAECQSHVGFHKMGDEYPPFHGHCVCYAVYIYN